MIEKSPKIRYLAGCKLHTLAGYKAGEIQLESLKLLPGTEMRHRAKELGISYSPLPPYEVLKSPPVLSAG